MVQKMVSYCHPYHNYDVFYKDVRDIVTSFTWSIKDGDIFPHHLHDVIKMARYYHFIYMKY